MYRLWHTNPRTCFCFKVPIPNSWFLLARRVGFGQHDDLGGKSEQRARDGPQAGFDSHAEWNPGINPVPSNSIVGHRIGRPMVSAVLH